MAEAIDTFLHKVYEWLRTAFLGSVDVLSCSSTTDPAASQVNINGVLVTGKNGLILASMALLSNKGQLVLFSYSGQDVTHDCSGPITVLSDLASTLLDRSSIVCLENGDRWVSSSICASGKRDDQLCFLGKSSSVTRRKRCSPSIRVRHIISETDFHWHLRSHTTVYWIWKYQHDQRRRRRSELIIDLITRLTKEAFTEKKEERKKSYV